MKLINIYTSDYLWIFLSKVLTVAISFVSSIILVKYFGKDLYGKYQYIISISILLSVFINFGYDRVMVKEINSKRFQLPSLLASLIVLKLFGSIVVLILGFFFLKLFQNYNLEYLFLLVIFSLILSSFSLKLVFESRNQNKYIFFSTIFSLFSSLILKIYLVIIQADINLFGFSIILEIILSNLIMLFFFLKLGLFLKIKINFYIIKKIFRQSFPIALSTILGMLYLYSDKIIMGGYEKFGEIAVYTIYGFFFSSALILSSSLSNLLSPILNRAFNEDKKKYFLMVQNFLSLSFIISIVISLFYLIFLQKIIEIIYGESFKGYGMLIYFLAFNSIVNSGSIFLVEYLLLINKSYLIIYTRLTSLLINIVSNFVLIPKYGVYGSALSLSISVLIFSVILNIFNYHLRNYLILYFKAFKDVFMNPKDVISMSYNFLVKKNK